MEELSYKDLFRDAVLMMAEVARAAGFDPSDENVEPPDVVARVEIQRAELERLGGSSGVLAEVAAERERQIAKGYDAAHDDGHDDSTLAEAAGLIALGSPDYIGHYNSAPDIAHHMLGKYSDDRRRQLIIAAALIVAEIDRPDRALTPTPAPA